MNEIVKYHNDLSNQIVIKTLNANELNFFMAICAKMRNQETNEILFTFEQLKKLTSWRSNDNKDFIKSLENTNKKLIALNFTLRGNGKIVQFVLFPTFTIDEKSKTLKVRVNQDFSYLLNDLSSNFTRFELENFTTLTSKYSKYLYKELMKFKSTGHLVMLIEDFREKLDIPKKYRMTHINEKVLKPIEKELSQVFQKFEIKKMKRGREITQIEFFFTLRKEKESIEIKMTSPGSSIENYWRSHFVEVNFTKKHQEVIEKLEKTMTTSQIINYLQEQWDFVKNNPSIENEPAYFSHLILGEKAVLKDYVSQNKIEELFPEEDKKQAAEFMEKVPQFRQTDIEEVTRNMEKIKKEKEEIKIIEVTKEEYEEIYQKHLQEMECDDSSFYRKRYDRENNKKYRIIGKIELPKEEILREEELVLETLKKQMEEMQKKIEEIEKRKQGKAKRKEYRSNTVLDKAEKELNESLFPSYEVPKVYTIEDIPEEKLLSKSGKKLVGSALQMRVKKILKEMNKKEGI